MRRKSASQRKFESEVIIAIMLFFGIILVGSIIYLFSLMFSVVQYKEHVKFSLEYNSIYDCMAISIRHSNHTMYLGHIRYTTALSGGKEREVSYYFNQLDNNSFRSTAGPGCVYSMDEDQTLEYEILELEWIPYEGDDNDEPTIIKKPEPILIARYKTQ